MTCIAAIATGGVVHMMGDSAGVAGWDLSLRKDNKVFRMGQLLQYNLSVPEHHSDVDLFTYMVTAFIPAVRDCLKSGGYARIESNEERGGCFLVGFKGRLFQIESDFQVGESLYPFDAVGCSAPYALGALSVLIDDESKTPEQALSFALLRAERFSAGVRRPFHYEKTEPFCGARVS
ncbi:hypothetical protein ACM0P6_03005 [Komagataeibacter sucrofermentans]|uniref:Uncharacterized protein n=1 Tax=Komagataeibacter sucrofermentans TaxID=1053551 RepID=A0A318QPT8_9PROT|nr:hypothetical protein [Komagataeibacter sucrofermentans]PYD79954.1 hypothetical protein CFR77_05440 [Komagataeibacter sucrofermentans]GBQ52180.1 hypothetical protein AA15973_2682 [Komagataeibacter sucrofermentans DSM 15973]